MHKNFAQQGLSEILITCTNFIFPIIISPFMRGKVRLQTVLLGMLVPCIIAFAMSGSGTSHGVAQLPKLDVQITLNQTEVGSAQTLRVSVFVSSGGVGVEGAYVEFWLSQEGGTFTPPNTTTDSQGKAETVLTTPITQVTLVCSLSVNAAKEGYESAMNSTEFTLLPLPRLEVSLSADNVNIYNNQSVRLTVYVHYNNQPVADATVRMALAMGLRENGEEYFSPSNGTTNAEGKFLCIFTPPYVSNETEFGVVASVYADGYSENTSSIAIKVSPGGNQTGQTTQKTPDYSVSLVFTAFCTAGFCIYLRRRLWE